MSEIPARGHAAPDRQELLSIGADPAVPASQQKEQRVR